MTGPSCGRALNKARDFWARLNALRRTPGHCNRCGKPHDGPLKQCDHCREYHKQYKAVRANKRQRLNQAAWAQLVKELDGAMRRIASLEIAVANLQWSQREAYKRGYNAGKRNRRLRLARRIEGLRGEHSEHRRGCATSAEELSTLCHAYKNLPRR